MKLSELTEQDRKKDKNSQLTKYGGWHWMILIIPMNGNMPIKMDGSQYSDDPYEIYNSNEEQESEFHVAGPTDIENFIKACRCNDEDFEKWRRAVKLDMREEFDERHYVKDFFKTAKLEAEPVRGEQLCSMLQKGAVVMVTEVTEYFLIVHIGNDMTKLFKAKIAETQQKGLCSYLATEKAFSAQRAHRCRTCFGNDIGMAICDACIAKCHRGHDTYVVFKRNKRGKLTVPKTLMYCDCGYKLNCQCLDE